MAWSCQIMTHSQKQSSRKQLWENEYEKGRGNSGLVTLMNGQGAVFPPLCVLLTTESSEGL